MFIYFDFIFIILYEGKVLSALTQTFIQLSWEINLDANKSGATATSSNKQNMDTGPMTKSPSYNKPWFSYYFEMNFLSTPSDS